MTWTDRLPADVTATVTTLHRALVEAIGPKLEALAVYGSAARGDFDRRRSDVNVLVCLADSEPDTLRAIAPTLRAAFRASRVVPYITSALELTRLADVFPVKVLEMQQHHVLVHGADPLTSLRVEREHLRLRTEQELRNHLMRLRNRYVHVTGELPDVQALLRQTARTLRFDLAALLHLGGAGEVPADRRGLFVLAARTHDLPMDVLERLDRCATGEADREPERLASATITLLGRIVEIADQSVRAE